jgi:hypothetical protein
MSLGRWLGAIARHRAGPSPTPQTPKQSLQAMPAVLAEGGVPLAPLTPRSSRPRAAPPCRTALCPICAPAPPAGNSSDAQVAEGPGGVLLLPLQGLRISREGEPLTLVAPDGSVASTTGDDVIA